ncbi:MAG: hypothetical protein WCI43_08285 [Candidatus Firestonebacteria bacterium]
MARLKSFTALVLFVSLFYISAASAWDRKFESIDQYKFKEREDNTKLTWFGVSTLLVYSAPCGNFLGYNLNGSLGPSLTAFLRNLLFCDLGINIEGFAYQPIGRNGTYYAANGKVILRFNGRSPEIAPGVGFFEIGGGAHVRAENLSMPNKWSSKAFGMFFWGFGYEVCLSGNINIKVELSFLNSISANPYFISPDAPAFMHLGFGTSFEL